VKTGNGFCCVKSKRVIMGNIGKAIMYFKRNGIKNTAYAVLERLQEKKKTAYTYMEPDEDELQKQREAHFAFEPLISVLVPCYETKPVFLEDLVLSLQDQTYTKFEIVLADASKSTDVMRVAGSLAEQYGNIVYHRLDSNEGISENTNKGLLSCSGDYIGLLDHDDLLTKDALYQVVKAINDTKKDKIDPILIYSDEDKTDTYLETFYEPHRKLKFNEDLILTNNYICHFSVYDAWTIKKLMLRKDYDGAQDFDLVLRTISYVKKEYGKQWRDSIVHVPEIIYHWRCHKESTASNPESKNYAYINGGRAIEDFLTQNGIEASVQPLKHLGFYRVEYKDGVFAQRSDIGAIGGPVVYKNKIISGALNGKGQPLFENLNIHFSGYMHRAALQQSVSVLDIRNIQIRPEYEDLFKETTGYSYPIKLSDEMLGEEKNHEFIKKSIIFCNKLKNKGINLLYDPEFCAAEDDK